MSGPALIAKLTSKPGQRDELTKVFQKLVAATEEEPGTLVYLLHHDANDENVVWFYERYESQAAFDAHGSSDTMKGLVPEMTELLGARPELTFLDFIGGKGL